MKLLVMHGPNLNLLGMREPEHYGQARLQDIDAALNALGQELGVDVESFQSNHEGELVERIQQAISGGIAGIVINPAAYTHTSVALRDALLATAIPFVEVHLSNVHSREEFRHRSLLSDCAVAVVCGFGPDSYTLALRGLASHLQQGRQT